MFKVFFYVSEVAIVLDECCKSRSECCICCNGYTHILQMSIHNVSSIFLDVLLHVCLSGYCIRFTYILQIFSMDITYVCNVFKLFSSCFQYQCFRSTLIGFSLLIGDGWVRNLTAPCQHAVNLTEGVAGRVGLTRTRPIICPNLSRGKY
jgi:hypothetical protein